MACELRRPRSEGVTTRCQLTHGDNRRMILSCYAPGPSSGVLKMRLCPRCVNPTPVLKGQSYCLAHKREVKKKSMKLHQEEMCSKCKQRKRATGHVWCQWCKEGEPNKCVCGKEHWGELDICMECANAVSRASKILARQQERELRQKVKDDVWRKWSVRIIKKLGGERNRWSGCEWKTWAQRRQQRLGRRHDSIKFLGKLSDGFSRKRPWRSLCKMFVSRLESLKKRTGWFQWACGKSNRLLTRVRRGRLPRQKKSMT